MATNPWSGKPTSLCNPPIFDIVLDEMPSKLQNGTNVKLLSQNPIQKHLKCIYLQVEGANMEEMGIRGRERREKVRWDEKGQAFSG